MVHMVCGLPVRGVRSTYEFFVSPSVFLFLLPETQSLDIRGVDETVPREALTPRQSPQPSRPFLKDFFSKAFVTDYSFLDAIPL